MELKKVFASAVVAVGMAGTAGATTLDASNWAGCPGTASCTVGVMTVNALPQDAALGGPSTLSAFSFRGLTGLGVSSTADNGNAQEGEIQALFNENVEILLSRALVISNVQLGHFYSTDTFGSDPLELTLIEGFLGDTLIGTVSAQVTSAGVIGVVNATGAVINAFQGHYSLSNLFQGAAVDRLVFDPILVGSSRVDNSDYTIVSVTAVPLPASALLLLGGVAGLAAVRRRRKAA